jgi:ribonuclease HI
MIVGSGKAMSNNVAEYAALNRFLDWYLQSGLIIPNIAITERPTIYSDSQLLINQMNGIWKARGGLYYPHYAKAKNTIIANRLSLAFWWIPREQNSEADELSKEPLIKAGIKFRIQPQ